MSQIFTDLLPEAIRAVLRREGNQRIKAGPLLRMVRQELNSLGHEQAPDIAEADFITQLDAAETAALLANSGISLWKVEDFYRIVDHQPLSGQAAAELMDRSTRPLGVVETSSGPSYARCCRFCDLQEAEYSGQLIEHDRDYFHPRCVPQWDAAKSMAAEWRVSSRQGHAGRTAALIHAMTTLAHDRRAIACSFEKLLGLLLGYMEPQAVAYWRQGVGRLRGLVMQDAGMNCAMAEARVALWLVNDDVRLVDLSPPLSSAEAAARLSLRSHAKGRCCSFCGIEESATSAEMLICRTGVVHRQCEHALFQWQRTANSASTQSARETIHVDETTQPAAEATHAEIE